MTHKTKQILYHIIYTLDALHYNELNNTYNVNTLYVHTHLKPLQDVNLFKVLGISVVIDSNLKTGKWILKKTYDKIS